MPLKTKRWDDPVEPDDGLRVLVCRYRPRGVRKEDETWDVWTPNLGTCSPKQPVSVQTFHGTDDATNPFPGSDDARWGYSVEAALARWADIDRCKRGPTTGSVTPTVSLITYSRCESRTTVELYLEQGGGHTWPGSNAPPIGSDNASALILRFFKKHSLDQRK